MKATATRCSARPPSVNLTAKTSTPRTTTIRAETLGTQIWADLMALTRTRARIWSSIVLSLVGSLTQRSITSKTTHRRRTSPRIHGIARKTCKRTPPVAVSRLHSVQTIVSTTKTAQTRAASSKLASRWTLTKGRWHQGPMACAPRSRPCSRAATATGNSATKTR